MDWKARMQEGKLKRRKDAGRAIGVLIEVVKKGVEQKRSDLCRGERGI
jgi:hypothetical protein